MSLADPICLWTIVIVLVITLVFVLLSSAKIIRPYEQGLYEKLGKFIRILEPGMNFVMPFISDVYHMDLRTQTLDVPRQEVITKDNSPTVVDAIIYIKVVDPIKAHYEIQDYRMGTINLAQTNLRAIIGDMELDEVLYNRVKINTTLRNQLDEATDPWGVKVEMVEIREVDPVGPVKAAMEEQTAAERERRAAILRADGKKRSAILNAEGEKRARILEAEGVRQSKVLEAEGERMAKILNAQGEANRLRILALGSAPLDQKSLTVLSLDALKSLGNGKATKMIFPFEITRLLESASEYIGSSRKEKEHTAMSLEDLERTIGKPDDVLGKIPRPEEIKSQLSNIEKETQKESQRTEEIAHMVDGSGQKE